MTEIRIVERFLDENRAAARITCPQTLVPAPGQYVLARHPASRDPLAVPVFSAGDSPEGFFAAPPLPRDWSPGVELSLRGPLGRGFSLPVRARRVALAALDVTPACLLGLVPRALAQNAAVTLVCADPPEDLPDEVEIRPLGALAETCRWADYLALAAGRDGWRARVRSRDRLELPREAQALIVAPMPCGGLAQCGVCSVEIKKGIMLACEDGPVFDL